MLCLYTQYSCKFFSEKEKKGKYFKEGNNLTNQQTMENYDHNTYAYRNTAETFSNDDHMGD